MARRPRADERLAGARLVAPSGFGRDADRRGRREAGFDRHLTKPADPDVLRGLLAGLTESE